MFPVNGALSEVTNAETKKQDSAISDPPEKRQKADLGKKWKEDWK